MRLGAFLLFLVAAAGFLGCSPLIEHVDTPGQGGDTGVSPEPERLPDITREQSKACSAPGKRLCLVAFGALPADWMQEWADHLRTTYRIEVEVLTPVDPMEAWNPQRRQISAEGAIGVVQREYQAAIVNPDHSFVIMTTLDMYTKDVEPFIFGITRSSQYGIVSGYHLDPAHRGSKPDEALLKSRMLKFATKYLGITYYDLPQVSDFSSLMYGPIDSVAKLDAVPAELPKNLVARP